MVQQSNPEPAVQFPPLAHFMSRFFAWATDGLLLLVVWQIITAICSMFPIGIVRYRYPAGAIFLIAYFGIMNSKICGGQTLGKRLFKAAVRNQSNQPIGWGRSTIRSMILAAPVLLLDQVLPAFANPGLAWLLSWLFFGVGGTILYTMIFNHRAGQGIHDLLLGTYVVNLAGKPIHSFPTTPRIHYVISTLWLSIVAVASLVPILLASSYFNSDRADQPPPPDCLAPMEDDSVILFSNVTHTAYRSIDGGMTWNRDKTVDQVSGLPCEWGWPAALNTEPPVTFYYMEDLGIYQSLDRGETLTLVPLELGEDLPSAVSTPFNTLIVSIGGGDLWVRRPSGVWIQYKERASELRLEPVPERRIDQ
jgi:uncharacterized RDD family membrane protein YckC